MWVSHIGIALMRLHCVEYGGTVPFSMGSGNLGSSYAVSNFVSLEFVAFPGKPIAVVSLYHPSTGKRSEKKAGNPYPHNVFSLL